MLQTLQELFFGSRLSKLSIVAQLTVLVLLTLTVAFGLALFLSFYWRMQHDTPLLHYAAFLIDQYDKVPYRDIYETSFIGSFLFHLAIGKTLGYGDTAFRIVDILVLSGLLLSAWLLIAQFHRMLASIAIMVCGLMYLGEGPGQSLQRDYIALLPITIALVLGTSESRKQHPQSIQFIVGLLFGLAASIKPHLAIGLPAVLVYLAFDNNKPHSLIKKLWRPSLLACLGFLSVLGPMMIWLWAIGGFTDFVEIFRSYIPLHLSMTGEHVTITGTKRWIYLINTWLQFGGYTAFVPLVLLAFYTAWKKRSEASNLALQRKLALFATIWVLYAIYPLFSGQFWPYHWMPFVFFSSLFSVLLLLPIVQTQALRNNALKSIGYLLLFVLGLLLLIRPAPESMAQLEGFPPPPPKSGRVDAIADFLRDNLQAEDKVQSLDWTGGAIHAMLIAKAPTATPFLYNYHFYHHISEPYIQQLRQRLLQGLRTSKPRFIVEVTASERPSGKDTTMAFKLLNELLEHHYFIVQHGTGYRIYQRKKATEPADN